MKLISMKRSGTFEQPELTYEFRGRLEQGKSLDFKITLEVTENLTNNHAQIIKIDFGDLKKPTVDETLDRLGEWFTSAGKALTERKRDGVKVQL